MATITVDDEAVTIELTLWERIAGLLRSQRIPLDTIKSCTLEETPKRALAGLRAPGLAVPFGAKIGTWRGNGRRYFVRIDRSSPAVHLETSRGPYDAYLVSITDAHRITERIAQALPGGE
jgi:hypothetical protein